MKILIGCIFFKNLTGSEMYVYQLASSLIKKSFSVSIVSDDIGCIMVKKANQIGIEVYNFNNLPLDQNFDIIHCQHFQPTLKLINLFPNIPKISTIHSELNGAETPVKHQSIKKYIAIRPTIKQHLIHNWKIEDEKIVVIYNPIDETRFNKNDITYENFLLFVGTIDPLRKNTIYDLAELTKKRKMDFCLIGKNHDNYLKSLLFQYPHIKYLDETDNVEQFFKKCSETGGILLGRTTIEGWMCGKPGWIYDIDSRGNIIQKDLFEPCDIERFLSENVIEQIIKEYEFILQIV